MLRNIRTFALLLVLAGGPGLLAAQQFNARNGIAINSHCNGFYEYLPAGYNPAGTQKYPLLIALHGVGERGDGSNNASTGLPLLINTYKGLASLIYSGGFPSSFTVDGNTFRFIVICPQFTDNGATWPDATDLDAVLNYALIHYKADPNRIYLTGLSMGGGICYNYITASSVNAGKIAAVVPVCAAILPGPPFVAKPDSLACRNLTSANLPLWATHNLGDNIVPVSFTDSLVHYINAAPAPINLARKKIFTSWMFEHDAWTATYDPNSTQFDGLNIYQWMLQYQRFITPLPVNLKNYRAYHSGRSTITISWQTENETNNDHFTLERSEDGKNFTSLAVIKGLNRSSNYSVVDEHPLRENYYRLSQTDGDGRTTYYRILKIAVGSTPGILKIQPNPAREILHVALNAEEPGIVTLSIYGIEGRLMKQFFLKTENSILEKDISISQLTKGNYWLQLTTQTGSYSRLFIKE